MEQIDIHKAKEMIDQKEAVIVDVRDSQAFADAHIDNAHNLNDSNIDKFLKTTDKNKTLLCFCYHGFSSQSAATFLESNGFNNVYSVDGGFEEWRQRYPTVSG